MALELPAGMRGPSSADARGGLVRYIALDPQRARYELCTVGAERLLRDLFPLIGLTAPTGPIAWTAAVLAALRERVTREIGGVHGSLISATSMSRAALRAAVWLVYEQPASPREDAGTPDTHIWFPSSLTLPALGVSVSDATPVSCAPITATAPATPAQTTPGQTSPRETPPRETPPAQTPPRETPPVTPAQAGMMGGSFGLMLGVLGAVGLGAVVVSRVAPPDPSWVVQLFPPRGRETPAPPPRNPPARSAMRRPPPPQRKSGPPDSLDGARALLGGG